MGTGGHEGNPLKCTAPRASFHHGGVACLAVISETGSDRGRGGGGGGVYLEYKTRAA